MAFTDIFVFGVILLLLGVTIMATGYMTGLIEGIPLANQTTTINGTTLNAAQWGVQMSKNMNWIYMVFLTLVTLAMIAGGFVLPSHPAFAVLSVFVLIVWLALAPFLTNAYVDVLLHTPIGDMQPDYPLVHGFLMNMPLYGLIVGLVSGIILHGKRGNEGYGVFQ